VLRYAYPPAESTWPPSPPTPQRMRLRADMVTVSVGATNSAAVLPPRASGARPPTAQARRPGRSSRVRPRARSRWERSPSSNIRSMPIRWGNWSRTLQPGQAVGGPTPGAPRSRPTRPTMSRSRPGRPSPPPPLAPPLVCGHFRSFGVPERTGPTPGWARASPPCLVPDANLPITRTPRWDRPSRGLTDQRSCHGEL
jgi:hypothetical protein